MRSLHIRLQLVKYCELQLQHLAMDIHMQWRSAIEVVGAYLLATGLSLRRGGMKVM